MKKLFLFSTVVFFFFFVSLGFAAEPEVDSERAAQALAKIIKRVKTLNGTFYFLQPEGNTTSFKSGEIVALVDGTISRLVIDRRDIVIDGRFIDPKRADQAPRGVPEEELVGATSFNLTVWGRDENRRAWVFGEIRNKTILPGDPIIITLRPLTQEYIVSFNLPEGTDPDDISLRVQGTGLFGLNEYNWPYDPFIGGFSTFLDPLFVHQYQVVNSATGNVFDFGTLDILLGSNGVVSVHQHILNNSLIGNVVDVPFTADKGYVYLPQQPFDGSVVRCEEPPCDPDTDRIPAKVYFAHLGGQSFRVTSFSSRDVTVEIREWRATGELPLLAHSGGLITVTEIPSGKSIVLITIFSPDATPDDKFFVEFVRSSFGFGDKG